MAIAYFGVTFAGLSGASAIILGGALAMSSTAVAIQVQPRCRGGGTRESTSAK